MMAQSAVQTAPRRNPVRPPPPGNTPSRRAFDFGSVMVAESSVNLGHRGCAGGEFNCWPAG